MREQSLSRFGCATKPNWHAGQKRNQRSFKSVLKQQRKIKLPSPPFAHLRKYRKGSPAIIKEHVVDEVCLREDSFSTGTYRESDLRLRQYSSEGTKRRNSHHGVANPVRATHDDSLDVFGLKRRHR